MSSGGGESQLPDLSPSVAPGMRTHSDVEFGCAVDDEAAAPATLFKKRVKWGWNSIAASLGDKGAVRYVQFDNLDTSEVKGGDGDERVDELESEREMCARVEQGASESGLQEDLLFANDVLRHQCERAADVLVSETLPFIEGCDANPNPNVWGGVFGAELPVYDAEQLPAADDDDAVAGAAGAAGAAGLPASESNPSDAGELAAELLNPLPGVADCAPTGPSSSSRVRKHPKTELELQNLATVANARNFATATTDLEISTATSGAIGDRITFGRIFSDGSKVADALVRSLHSPMCQVR